MKLLRAAQSFLLYYRDLKLFKEQEALLAEKLFPLGKPQRHVKDRYMESGSAKGHYFHQDLLVAKRIYINKPSLHVDVGSRVDGFVAHVASFRCIEVLDIRPLSNKIPNIRFMQSDLMVPIHYELVNYCDSLSCLHAIEHFGLGRYGDPVNYNGHIIGLDNLFKILKKNGKFYFSVPIGPQRIEFNAHRVFSINYLLKYFSDKYQIDQFSFVDDSGDLHENVEITDTTSKNNFGCQLGCGIFEMTKL